jgi:hypothetical protein
VTSRDLIHHNSPSNFFFDVDNQHRYPSGVKKAHLFLVSTCEPSSEKPFDIDGDSGRFSGDLDTISSSLSLASDGQGHVSNYNLLAFKDIEACDKVEHTKENNQFALQVYPLSCTQHQQVEQGKGSNHTTQTSITGFRGAAAHLRDASEHPPCPTCHSSRAPKQDNPHLPHFRFLSYKVQLKSDCVAAVHDADRDLDRRIRLAQVARAAKLALLRERLTTISAAQQRTESRQERRED